MTITAEATDMNAETITATIATYEARLAAVRERYDAYHPDMCSRRYVADEYSETQARIRGTRKFLAGDYDATYAGAHPSWPGTTLEEWRAWYASDTVRAALHHLLWAEHYAGLRDRESARTEDPWNKR